MSEKYDEYIKEHKENVFKAFEWLDENLPEIFPDEETSAACCYQCEFSHDDSKFSKEEYSAYDKYFYGGNQSYEVVQDFNRAWLHHIHMNHHHWQHWVLNNDDPNEGEIILDMPDVYIIEMICDWWSFSIKQDKPMEIFDWYKEHKDYMKLSDNTRKKVENILAKMEVKLLELNDVKLTLKSDVNEEN